uniref:SWIM-type domain-containing protein n=1 Tax=Fagus sylvatica TaxID=28930 RepID=A0A2N9F741_FAGSY
MARGKLILICQSGGEFVTNEDGSMSYTGGEAHAVDINNETLFDDLKLKLAEMWNLEYKSLSIKYFLPGNRRTLITLSNDKDLKRMYDFHGSSVTADVFVMGRTGFDREALNICSRACGIKLAEAVTPIAVCTTSAAAHHAVTGAIATYTTAASSNADDSICPAAITPLAAVSPPIPTGGDSVTVKGTAKRPAGVIINSNLSSAHTAADNPDAAYSSPSGSVAVATDATTHDPTIIDMSSTPADTVKKRRRTASWKIGANGPAIVAVTDYVEEKRKITSIKKNIQNHSTAIVADDLKQQEDIFPCEDDSNSSPFRASSNDVPPDKLVASWKDGIIGVGQEFKGVHEFRDALQKYAIAHRFMYKLKKNDTNRASGICGAEGCSWRIHASWDSSSQSFRIKKMNKTHTCGGESWKSAHPSKNWLVSIIKDKLRDSPHHKPKEIANSILQDFGIELNYTQVWRGIEDAREQLQGSYKEAYNQLPELCEKMLEANAGSFVKLCTAEDKRFQRLFLSFHASIYGFENGCRPLLFLDTTSLKSKYHEILLTATALDGDDGIFPVAFAIVDAENDDNWQWFLEQLKSAMSTSRSITFVSDREKSLKKLVLAAFHNADYGYSIYHLMENFKKNLKGPFHGDGRGSLPGNFVAAAHAVRLDGFRMCIEQIKRVSSIAYDWVMQIEPEYWTNAVFKGERYNYITVNVAELYTNWIEEVRELPIIQKVEVLRSKLMELICTRQMEASRWSTKLTPSKEEKLHEKYPKANGLKVLISSDSLFEVHDDSIHVVDIDKWECSCLGWKATGLPCHHAIAVFNSTGRNVYDYCSGYFTVDRFRLTYSESVNPLSGTLKPLSNGKTALDSPQVLPPCTSRPPSEHRERTKTKGVSKRPVSCTRCKELGHNKSTCKANL